MHDITAQVEDAVASSGVSTGLCTIFISHTSASLVIQEGADPDARRDLERFLARLVPEGDPMYTHTAEGPDDMPSHVRSALTSTSLSIPVVGGRAALGTWQHVFLWEHRRRGHSRRVVIHLLGTGRES
jgi:secondary thiamine-phosphate synthase enzyme